ncbi:MAG: CMD domain protein [Chelatococcus sp.]|nr:MAG: CMD domain protein [Chelatococcus sp.]
MTLIEELAGVQAGSPVASALAQRAEIMGLSQASHDAVLLPRDPGGLSHAERAALAARMAGWNADPALVAHYRALLAQAGESPALTAIAVGENAPVEPRFAAIIRHADLLTQRTREARKEDVAALVAAGVTEPDIVRLAELAAFVNYQARVIAGLRLLGAAV